MNRSEIFRNAHRIRKTNNVSLSVALKISWAAAKSRPEQKLTVSPWAKGTHSRVYIETVDGTKVYVDLADMEVKHRGKGYERNFTRQLEQASKTFLTGNY